MFSAAFVCLCVCLFLNKVTCERVNVGGGRIVGALYKNPDRVRLWSHTSWSANPPPNVALCYDVGKISTGYLVLIVNAL